MSSASARQTDNESDHGNDQKDDEKDLGDAGCAGGNATEAQEGRDQRDDQKDNGVMQHGGFLEKTWR